MIFLATTVDAQENLLGQVLRFLGVVDQMVHDGHESMMIQLDQLGEGLGVVVACAQHEPNVGIAQRQLCAGLAGQRHGRLAPPL